jgi:hypothetical protein
VRCSVELIFRYWLFGWIGSTNGLSFRSVIESGGEMFQTSYSSLRRNSSQSIYFFSTPDSPQLSL